MGWASSLLLRFCLATCCDFAIRSRLNEFYLGIALCIAFLTIWRDDDALE